MTELFSSAAVIGALVGLAIGLLQYSVLARSVFPRIEAVQNERRAHGESVDNSLGVIKSTILISDLIIFPAVGWFAGPFVASALGWSGS